MEVLFKKYFWLVNSLFLVGFGYATSRTLSTYLEYEVFKVPYVEEASAAEPVDAEEETDLRNPTAARSVDLERRRQLSQATTPELASNEQAEDETAGEAPDEEEKPAEEETPDAQIDLEYIAAITSTDPSKNMALVKVDGGDNKWVFIEDELKPGFKVSGISSYYIAYLVADRGYTVLLWEKKKEGGETGGKILAGGPAMAGPEESQGGPAAAAPREETPQPAQSNSPYASGIKQVGPNQYNIDRTMLNEQLQDLGKLGREARVIPNYDRESGTYKGFKLIGVRPNSLYRAIGIRSGDVISQINGEELSSPGKALELFNKLQNSNDISLDLMRRGKQQTLTYKIE